jgi:hypothetical protein
MTQQARTLAQLQPRPPEPLAHLKPNLDQLHLNPGLQNPCRSLPLPLQQGQAHLEVHSGPSKQAQDARQPMTTAQLKHPLALCSTVHKGNSISHEKQCASTRSYVSDTSHLQETLPSLDRGGSTMPAHLRLAHICLQGLLPRLQRHVHSAHVASRSRQHHAHYSQVEEYEG